MVHSIKQCRGMALVFVRQGHSPKGRDCRGRLFGQLPAFQNILGTCLDSRRPDSPHSGLRILGSWTSIVVEDDNHGQQARIILILLGQGRVQMTVVRSSRHKTGHCHWKIVQFNRGIHQGRHGCVYARGEEGAVVGLDLQYNLNHGMFRTGFGPDTCRKDIGQEDFPFR